MNVERAALKGRLADAKQELQRLEIRGNALMKQIHHCLDPYADSVTDLDANKAQVLLQDLVEIRNQAASLKAKIAEFEQDLNG